MAAVMPGMGSVHSSDKDKIHSSVLTAAALLIWAVIGPLVGIVYEFRISVHDWGPAGPSMLLQLDDAKLAYFNQAQTSFFIGSGVWILGLIVLTYIYARINVYQR